MGSIVAKLTAESVKKQQDFMLESQRLQLERQLQMQNLMRERMAAMQLARTRELFNWIFSFTSLVTLGAVSSAMKYRRAYFLGVPIPFMFITGYFYDLGFGNKISRMQADAEYILAKRTDILRMPANLPTFEEIELRRLAHDKLMNIK